MELYLSNRLENLAEAMMENIQRDRLPPMRPEVILVQSRGMARWLNLQTATKCGIQLNSEYVFPRVLIDHLIQAVLPDYESAEMSPFNRASLKWFIFENLPFMEKLDGAEPIRNYLANKGTAAPLLRRYLLAEKMAYFYDQHQVYRPDLLQRWESSPTPETWKAACWKYMRKTMVDELPFSGAISEFPKKLEKLAKSPRDWPPSLHIFGISSLPPVYLNILKAVSKWMPCRMYLTQPSPQYWGDFAAKKQLLRKGRTPGTMPESPLLGNLGRTGQDLVNLLIDNEVFTSDASERFSQPEGSNLLNRLQRDLYDIIPPPIKKRAVNPAGLQVRICHSPKREIEVLKNQLHKWFEEDKTLRPDQIVVMAPDIETYADHIRACFGNDSAKESAIPFAMSDHSATRDDPAGESFLALLQLMQNRLTARDVYGLLTHPVLASRFGFAEDDWLLLNHWLQATAIRWGLDANHRKEETGVAFDDFSWKQGVDKLVAGYCFHPSASGQDAFEDLYPHMEGNQANLLNRFLEFWEFLEGWIFRIRTELARMSQKSSTALRNIGAGAGIVRCATLQGVDPTSPAHPIETRTSAQSSFARHEFSETCGLTPANWVRVLREMADNLFQDQEELAAPYRKLRTIISDFERETSIHEAKQPIGLDIVIRLLEEKLSVDSRSGGFFSGGITFCSMKPMRNIPARKIALIGLDEKSFPRRDFNHEFNTFLDDRRPGDRSLREDDRYLFLESILSAREELYLSYCGFDAKDLTPVPPSTIVEELLDHLDQYYTFPGAKDSRDALLVREHLQPFNPHYFTGPDPTYDTDNLEAAKALIEEVRERVSFFQSPLPETEISHETLPLDSFIQFFQNPCAYWLRHRLGIDFPHSQKYLEDAEPMNVKGLNLYLAMQSMIQNKWEKIDDKKLSLSQYLPVGEFRSLVSDDLNQQAETFVDSLEKTRSEGRGETFEIDLKLDRFRIRGQLQNVTPTGYLKFRYSKLNSREVLAAWIEHLALCTSLRDREFSTNLRGRTQLTGFPYVGAAAELLEALEKVFTNGINSPQPIFPQASYFFAKYTVTPPARPRTAPLAKAKYEFLKTPSYKQFERGDGYEPYIRMCFPDVESALSPAFQSLSLSVYGEMLKRLQGDSP